MAKKKKHHKKSRKLRKQNATLNKPSLAATAVAEPATTKQPTEFATKSDKKAIVYDDVEMSYVRTDVRKTLILIGIILVVYAVIWVLMTRTSLGNQALHLFSR